MVVMKQTASLKLRQRLIPAPAFLAGISQSYPFTPPAPFPTRLASCRHDRKAAQRRHLMLLDPSSRGNHHALPSLCASKAGGCRYAGLLDRCQAKRSIALHSVYLKHDALGCLGKHQQLQSARVLRSSSVKSFTFIPSFHRSWRIDRPVHVRYIPYLDLFVNFYARRKNNIPRIHHEELCHRSRPHRCRGCPPGCHHDKA